MEIWVVWVAFAIIVGVAAQQKGRNAFGWFALSLLLSPVIALILLVAVGTVRPATGVPQPIIGLADELTKLAALRDSGTISPAEFDRQRDILLPPPVGNVTPFPDTCLACGAPRIFAMACPACGQSYDQIRLTNR